MLVRDPDGKMEPQAFFCTDTDMDPADVISNFAKRWEMEVTFQEVHTHLGVETQWSKKAITRTTPALLGLYSLVCLRAQQALESNQMSYAAAWYKKTNFTFSDAIAVIRCEIFLGSVVNSWVSIIDRLSSQIVRLDPLLRWRDRIWVTTSLCLAAQTSAGSFQGTWSKRHENGAGNP